MKPPFGADAVPVTVPSPYVRRGRSRARPGLDGYFGCGCRAAPPEGGGRSPKLPFGADAVPVTVPSPYVRGLRARSWRWFIAAARLGVVVAASGRVLRMRPSRRAA
ncbi:hypothetical protein Airi02_002950 [Actinoallomurus iriomotensis]|uniref:Uncharacterized protein n=1 Tax=Actinoallomurus iriomotensis TaxID=478107 RepID=A0A9W6RVE0_9ACTN|nr:hypothetical protein Airi02_002950 [Actinoallomurus iriomotensis]